MKDSEFTELLNLYLDHEISAADAARLEAEVQSNAARRRMYQDYCRMQKACKMLAQDFATDVAPEADSKVVAFEQARASHERRQITTRYVAGGLFAAAACVAVIFIGRHHTAPATPSGDAVAQMAPVVPVSTVSAPVAATSEVVASTGATISHDGQSRSFGTLGTHRDGQADGLALTSTQDDPHFAWLQDVRLTPLQDPTQVGQLHLNTNPALRTDTRNFSANKPLPSDVQWTAIRFQK